MRIRPTESPLHTHVEIRNEKKQHVDFRYEKRHDVFFRYGNRHGFLDNAPNVNFRYENRRVSKSVTKIDKKCFFS